MSLPRMGESMSSVTSDHVCKLAHDDVNRVGDLFNRALIETAKAGRVEVEFSNGRVDADYVRRAQQAMTDAQIAAWKAFYALSQ